MEYKNLCTCCCRQLNTMMNIFYTLPIYKNLTLHEMIMKNTCDTYDGKQAMGGRSRKGTT